MPKAVPIEDLKKVLKYDPKTGHFTWIAMANKKHARPGALAGTQSHNYWAIGYKGRHYLAHRLAWQFHYGSLPLKTIDHINRDCLDNRISNLREASQAENSCNRGKPSNNSSGHKGVNWDAGRNKWLARIKVGYRQINLGRFVDLDEAIAAYARAAQKHHGQFAKL